MHADPESPNPSATPSALHAETCSSSPVPTREDGPIVDSSWDGYGDDDDGQCHFCGGDGWVDGDELGDPGWYIPGELYRCTCCGGSGNAAHCTFW